MVESDTRVVPHTGDVAAKVIDGEAIIMNLANGLYFSMDEVGSAIWSMIEKSASVGEMSAHLSARYDAEPEAVARDVERLVGELLDEGLVIVSEGLGSGSDSLDDAIGSASAYAPPTLHKYDDMADLLALDPPMPGLGDLPAE